MKRLSIILVALLGFVLCGQANTAWNDSEQQIDRLDSYTLWQIMWMHEQEKLAKDLYLSFDGNWDQPTFASIAAKKRHHMDEMMAMIDYYDADPLFEQDEIGVFGDSRHSDVFIAQLARGQTSLINAYLAAAYVEEWNIQEYRNDIEAIDLGQCAPCEPLAPLRATYVKLLAGDIEHLRTLLSHLTGLGYTYTAQLLSQAEVDVIGEGVEPIPTVEFSLTSAFNDAWYYPGTRGQGFFITVHPDSKTIFLAWLTYDMELPDMATDSGLGDAGQRWLTAQGKYIGAKAALTVYSSSGGIFDQGSPMPVHKPVGSMLLEFEDCSSGTVLYDLPAIGRTGMIPIVRIAPDNLTECELAGQPAQ
jgi:hypothetical protein